MRYQLLPVTGETLNVGEGNRRYEIQPKTKDIWIVGPPVDGSNLLVLFQNR